MCRPMPGHAPTCTTKLTGCLQKGPMGVAFDGYTHVLGETAAVLVAFAASITLELDSQSAALAADELGTFAGATAALLSGNSGSGDTMVCMVRVGMGVSSGADSGRRANGGGLEVGAARTGAATVRVDREGG